MCNLSLNFMKLAQGTLLLVLINFSSTLKADGSASQIEKTEKTIIDQMVKAYGGESLTRANSIAIHDNYKELYRDQGVNAGFTEIFKNNISLTIDYQRKRKSLTSWESKERGNRLTKTIFDGSTGRTYDLIHKKFNEDHNLSFASLGSSVIRSHDAALARFVWDNKNTAKSVGKTRYRNQPHEKLSIKMGAGPELILYINQQTGLISKVTRTNLRFGEITYVFTNHKTTQGVTFATDLQLNVAGEPYRISVSRKIEVNPSLKTAFNQPANFEATGETIDTSKMTVRQLGDGIYFAGQGHTYSLFIDAGTHFYATGGNAGLKDRFEAVKLESGIDKPLKYQVVTHHHSDHLSGMKDAAKLGASFITVAEHMASVQASLSKEVALNRFLLVDKKAIYANGTIEVYDIPSTHSRHNLMVYIPSQKLLFTADHFSTDLKSNLPNADKGTVALRKNIQELQLDVEKFLGAHGARILTNADFQVVVDSFAEEKCLGGMAICAE